MSSYVDQHKPSRTMAKHGFFIIVLCCFTSVMLQIRADDQQTAKNHTVEEAYRVLGISPNPDGSLTREIRIPMVNATPFVVPTKPAPVALSRDVVATVLQHKACMRLYRPLKPPANKLLPLIIYLHGGDFVLFSATTVVFHNFCKDIASQIPAVVVSVEYRLAPEHRLPAAYDDAMAAVFWLRQQALATNINADPWVKMYADFNNIFLLGSASGGNIAYHTALRALNIDLRPLKIKGLIMNQPYFGGAKRTQSELRLREDPYVPLYVNDLLWTLALPPNATRDHTFSTPYSYYYNYNSRRRLIMPRTMVKGNSGDPLVDRGKMVVKMLESKGVEVVSVVVEGGYHGIELNNATAAQELYDYIKGFVHSTAC